jgi:hypothetical protein
MTGCLHTMTDKTHAALVAEARSDDPIPLATGGVVLLDEIGDLSLPLQGKLLRVLNGEMQYRLGAEGNPNFGFTFRGLVVLATWRDIDGQCQLRDDLRQRICQHRVRVPGLSEYPTAVRVQMIQSAAEVVQKEILDELVQIDKLLGHSDGGDAADVLAPDWLAHAHRSAGVRVPAPVIVKLADVEWAQCGQLRGLRAVLKRILCGMDPDLALAEARAAFGPPRKARDADTGVDRLRRYLAAGAGFSEGWREDRHLWADEMLQLLNQDDAAARQAVAESDRSLTAVKKELRNIARSGSNPSAD